MKKSLCESGALRKNKLATIEKRREVRSVNLVENLAKLFL